MNPGRLTTQIRSDDLLTFASRGHSNELGYGEINAYKAVAQSLPNQYIDLYFGSSTTLNDLSHVGGVTTLATAQTLYVPAGTISVLDGTLNAASSSSRLDVSGTLVIGEDAVMNKGHITVQNGGELIVYPGATFNFAVEAGCSRPAGSKWSALPPRSPLPAPRDSSLFIRAHVRPWLRRLGYSSRGHRRVLLRALHE